MNAMTKTSSPRLALSVGPLLYHWSRETLLQFYADLAESPADTIVLGETVCARRRELRLEDWLALARELRAAGLATEVVQLVPGAVWEWSPQTKPPAT